MKRSTVLVFLFGLFLGGCGSSRQGGEEAEVVRHYECLLRALATDDSLTLRREQHYVTDTLSSDVSFAFSHRHKYLYSWTDSYIFYNMMMKAGKAEVTTKLATYRFCRDVKRLAARMLDAGKEKQLEEMLRIVATRLQEHGMNDAAAVTAAAGRHCSPPAYPPAACRKKSPASLPYSTVGGKRSYITIVL